MAKIGYIQIDKEKPIPVTFEDRFGFRYVSKRDASKKHHKEGAYLAAESMLLKSRPVLLAELCAGTTLKLNSPHGKDDIENPPVDQSDH